MSNFYYCGVYYLKNSTEPLYYIYWNQYYQGKNFGKSFNFRPERNIIVNDCTWSKNDEPACIRNVIGMSNILLLPSNLPFDLLDPALLPNNINTFKHLKSIDELLSTIEKYSS